MKIFKSLMLVVLPVCSFIVQAASLNDYAENKIVDHMFRATAYSESAPASYYVALFTASCTDAAVGTEVSTSSTGYGRIAIARSLAGWTGTHGTTTGVSSGTNGTVSNAGIVQFGAPIATWNTITSFGVMDAITAGNPIVCTDLTTSKTINNGDAAPSFAIGALTIQIDN